MKTFNKVVLTTTLMVGTIVTATPTPTKHNHNGKWHTHVVPSINHTHNKAKKQTQGGVMMPLWKHKQLLKSLMKDPSSVKFGRFWKGEGLPNTGNIWCGYINAKNSYGAYTGESLFVSTVQVDQSRAFWLSGGCKPVK